MSRKLKTPFSSKFAVSLFVSSVVVSIVRLISDFTNDCICHIPIPQDYNEFLIFKRNCQCEYVPLSVVIAQYILYIVVPFVLSFLYMSWKTYEVEDDK